VANVLAVSPHLDDAVLSYGGQLASQSDAGHHVVVFTVFAGTPSPPYSPVALTYHSLWAQSGDPVAPRREEDRNALSVLGVTPRHGGYLDAIYRRDGSGDWLIKSSEPTEYQDDEPGLVADIADTIDELISELRPDRIFTCAAMGQHADHRRARDATLLAAARAGVPVAVWDDFPYVTWAPAIPSLPAAFRLSEPVAQLLSDEAWRARNKAIRCYESQLAMLEEDGIPLPTWFAEHCADGVATYGVDGIYEVVRRVDVADDEIPVAA
jgi:LmbE family N-acetylglucosaminyl deacetylase